MQLKSFTFNPLEENTYVLWDETHEAVIIDPGCYEKDEQEELSDFIDKQNLNVRFLLNTHAHIDHVLGNAFVKNKYRVPLYLHPLEKPVLKAAEVYAGMYGFPAFQPSQADVWMNEGETIKFGNTSLEILFLPGHSPGHVAFYHAPQKTIICGDVLFYRSIGRTDLPGGDYDTLIDSIQQKLFKLPNDVVVHCGHGPSTTLGDEKQFNPFCALSLS